MITHPAFSVEPWAVTEDAPAARRARAGRVGVRALQRPHRPARQPRRGRAVRAPRHLPQRLLRDAPAAVRRGRLRLPGGRPDRRQRHQRQAHPAAGRRRAVRHPLRRAARPHAARSTCAPATLRREVHWRSPSGREIEVKTDAARLASSSARWPRSATRSRPIDGRAAAGRRPVRARRQRAEHDQERRPARRRRAARAAGRRGAGGPRPARRARPPHRRERAADGGGDGPRRRGRRRARRRRRGRARPRPRVADGRARRRTTPLRFTKFLAYGWSSQRSLPSVRDQVDAAVASRQAHRLGRAASQGQREFLDDFWAHADVEIDGDGELQQAVRFALFHALQAGARAERRAIPAKGLTGPGYDGHAFWDTETFVLPLLTYTQPRGGRRRAALAPRDARPRARAREDARAARAPRSRGARSAGRSARAYWPAGTAGVPHQRRHRRRRDPLPARDRRRGVRGRRRASSCWCRRRGCGARSATTTTRARSTSTASPARTSTRRSPTTTSTRT